MNHVAKARRPVPRRRLALGVLVMVSAGDGYAQAARTSTFTVGVAEASTGAAVASAEVLLPELKRLVRTDGLGRAVLPGIPYGVHRVRVRLIGYAPSDVQLRFDRDTMDAVFRLEPSAVSIGVVDVTADAVPIGLKDFEIRKKQGIGRFLTAADLAGDADRDFQIVAMTRFPGLTLRTDDVGQTHLASTRSACGGSSDRPATGRGVGRIDGRSGKGSSAGSGEVPQNSIRGSCITSRPCLVQVYLDDIMLGESDPGLVRTWDLSGAEYYTGTSAPARYRRSGSACGVLLLWSKWR